MLPFLSEEMKANGSGVMPVTFTFYLPRPFASFPFLKLDKQFRYGYNTDRGSSLVTKSRKAQHNIT